MQKLFPIICLVILSYHETKAQFTDTTSYHVVLSAAGSINKTDNGSAYLLNNGLNIGMKKQSVVLNSSNTWLYGKQNNNLTNNDFSSSLNFNLYKTFPNFYYWGLLNYNTSLSLKLKNQLLAGLGIAYNIIDTSNAYINISNGVLFDKSNLIASENYTTYRNSLRLQYRFELAKIVVFSGNNFLQNSFDRDGDYIIRTTNSIGVKLRQWITFNTSLSYNRLNVTKSENLNLTYGLTFDRFF